MNTLKDIVNTSVRHSLKDSMSYFIDKPIWVFASVSVRAYVMDSLHKPVWNSALISVRNSVWSFAENSVAQKSKEVINANS